MIEEIRATAHCAKKLSLLSVGYLRMASEFPTHRTRYVAESAELRRRANWYLARARRLKAQVAS